MKKRLLSGSFAFFLIALLSLSWSQQQTKSRGARSLLSRPWKGKKWQRRSCKGPREQARGSAGFLSGSPSRSSPLSSFCACLMPFVTSHHELPECRVPVSSTEAGTVTAAVKQGGLLRTVEIEALLVIYSFTMSHTVTYVHRPRAPYAFQAGSWAAH